MNLVPQILKLPPLSMFVVRDEDLNKVNDMLKTLGREKVMVLPVSKVTQKKLAQHTARQVTVEFFVELNMYQMEWIRHHNAKLKSYAERLSDIQQ